jgi:AcrR family transcriptional regulator
MPRSRNRYHHGELRTALIDTAIDLIAEQGVRGFSMAAASRRLGVTAAAPYNHFTDRDELLVAVAVRACEVFATTLVVVTSQATTPTDQLAAAARAYVEFAALRRPLFEVLFSAGLDKDRHPDLQRAAQPIADVFLDPARLLHGGQDDAAHDLARTVFTTAHGHATLLLDGAFGPSTDTVNINSAAAWAANTTHAIVTGRKALHRPT